MTPFIVGNSKLLRALGFCVVLGLLAGCAGTRSFQIAEELSQAGKYDEAVAQYFEAVKESPDNQEYRMRLLLARSRAAKEHFEVGRRLLDRKEYKAAVGEFSQAVALDPTLESAAQELQRAQDLIRVEALISEAEGFQRARRFTQAKHNLEQALQLIPGNPKALELMAKVKQGRQTVMDGFELEVASDKPITLKFKDAKLQDVFDILSKLSGINFIFDEDIRVQTVSVFLENASFAQALELLLKMNDLGKKVLNPKTIIIYPKTKEKEKQFEDQIIQTFYLSNVDAKKAVNLLRTMLQLRKIYVHEELNALVIRDNPQVVKLAQQILEAADRADAEVVFDLELVEVSHSDRLDIGPKLSTYSIGLGFANPGSSNIVGDALESGGSTGNLVSGLSGLESFYTLPSASFEFAKTLTDSEILANPKIRVKNKDKAKVHVGTREPVITVTTTNDTRSDNIQYVDVGVKLDVEPTIQLDDTIVTKLSLEVSSVSDRRTTNNGSVALTITTTNAQTALTLKNGEQTVIGGLIRDDLSKNKNTFPLLGDLPVLGALFSSHNNNKQKREILLSITPHIVKTMDLPRADVTSIWSGGEDDLKAGPNFGAFVESFEPITDQAPILPVPGTSGEMLPAPSGPVPAAEAAPVPEAAVPPAAPQGVSEPIEAAVVPGEPPTLEVARPAAPPAVPQVAVPSIAVPDAEERARVYVSGATQVASGEEFTLEVLLADIRNLYSAPLFVSYDAQRLEFVKAEEGNFLSQDGQPTIFTYNANPAKGQLIVGYKQGVGGKGASGSGPLARLVFRAKSPGPATLVLNRINFRNPAGTRLVADGEDFTLEVR